MTALRAGAWAYPRHVALGALAAGLAVGAQAPVWMPLLLAALVAGVLAPRALGLVAAVTLLVAAAAGHARVRALEEGTLAGTVGTLVRAEATLTESPTVSPFGGWSALARVRGEPVLLRARPTTRPAAPGATRPSRVTPLPGTGAVVAVVATVKPPSDYARARHAHVELRARSAMSTGRARGGALGVVDRLRRSAAGSLRGELPAPERGLLRGMVLGDDAELPDAVREDFRTAGLTHLVAASGANIALLAALILALARGLRVPFVARWWLVAGAIIVYVPLAGGGPSIQRAGVMGVAGVVALLAGRPSSRVYALLLASAATLALDPRAVADPGWQLSFAAVVALLARAGAWRDRLIDRGVPRALAEALAVATAATLATAPLVAWHFGRFSLVSLPANVLAAPLVAPIMWMGMIAVVAGQLLPAAASALDGVLAYPLAVLVALARAAAGAPGASVTLAAPLVAACCAAVVLAIERRTCRRPVAAAAALLVAGGVALAAGPEQRPGVPQDLRVTFLDVGQGDATLVQDHDATVLFDTGPPEGQIVARLRRAGVTHLDLLVVTHAENDHAGGTPAVLTQLPTALMLDGRDGVHTPLTAQIDAALSATGVPHITPDAGQTLRAGALAVEVLWPRREQARLHAQANPNDRAIITEVRDGQAHVLLTADAESPVVLPLIRGRRADVLKVPHHGSADPGLALLLDELRPQIAGIEVGRGNPFGHPRASTLQALRTVSRVYRTDRDGSVRVERGPDGALMVVTER